jgi:hypothetical protein
MSNTNTNENDISNNYIVSALGKIYPNDYRYKISTEWELTEIKWLIGEGDFESIEDCEKSITKTLLNEFSYTITHCEKSGSSTVLR